VSCWGYGYFGQLGDGNALLSLTPVSVSGLTGVSAIGNGSLHTCAVLTDGTVECWGDDSFGQLGNVTTTNSSTPVKVKGLTGVIAPLDGIDS
jgi:alpha-tubulin suppressor-like RCC1 family protein